MEFEISTGTAEGGASVIAVTGELDLSNVDRLAEPVQDAVSEGQPLVLDLSPCTFIDSSGLRFVLQLHKELAENEKEMAIVVADGQIEELIASAIDTHRRGHRMVIADRRGHLAGVHVLGSLERQASGQRLQQGGLDPLTAAR